MFRYIYLVFFFGEAELSDRLEDVLHAADDHVRARLFNVVSAVETCTCTVKPAVTAQLKSS